MIQLRMNNGTVRALDYNHGYAKLIPTASAKHQLAQQGFQWTRSSFIRGVGMDGIDLRITFLNGSIYRYFGYADHFKPMMMATSKGRYFNKHIRKPTMESGAFTKEGAMSFEGVVSISDETMFEEMDKNQVVEAVKNAFSQDSKLASEVKITKDSKTQLDFIDVLIDGILVLIPLLNIVRQRR